MRNIAKYSRQIAAIENYLSGTSCSCLSRIPGPLGQVRAIGSAWKV